MDGIAAVTIDQVREISHEEKELLARRGLPAPGAGVPAEFWLARSDAELVGLAGIEWHGSHGLLRSVAVREGWEGQGIGTLLARQALDRFLERKAQDLFLLTTGASSFFARLGFVPVDRSDVPEPVLRSEEFTAQCPASATVMRLDRQRLETVLFYDRSAASVTAAAYGRASTQDRQELQELPVLGNGCCSGGGCGCGGADPEPASEETSSVACGCDPSSEGEDAAIPSWGCSLNPLFGEPASGEIVLDLGCGAGRNAMEAARRVGPEGHVYGLDLSPTMLEEARRHRDRLGLTQVSFLHAPMEAVPLPDASVDLVISDCVLNLSTDKPRVLREAYRVLKSGGRLAIADVVRLGSLPGETNSEGWCACVDGAITPAEYLELLKHAGFETPSVEVVDAGYGGGELEVAAAHIRARR